MTFVSSPSPPLAAQYGAGAEERDVLVDAT